MPRQKSQIAAVSPNASAEEQAVVTASVRMTGGQKMKKNEDTVDVVSLLEQLKILQERVNMLQTQGQQPTVPSFSDGDEENDDVEIRPDAYIQVISLCPFPLNLCTQPRGKGKVFSFTTFGSTKRIMYQDVVSILETHQNFLENGYFYIANRAVIRKNGLDDIYEKILTKEKILAILNGANNSQTISLFKSANENQQKVIIQMLVDKMASGEEVDLNLIDKLSRESGIKIQEKYETVKQYLDSLPKSE